VVIYVWKVIAWDKVLSFGSTESLTGDGGTWAGINRTIEKVARIFKR